jgi:hypothetical protein
MKRITPEEAHKLAGFGPELDEYYSVYWHDENLGVCGLSRLLFHYTVHVDLDAVGHNDSYCFASTQLAECAFDEWDGKGDPPYWHKHPRTSRYQNSFVFQGMRVHIQNGQVERVELLTEKEINDEAAREEAAPNT